MAHCAYTRRVRGTSLADYVIGARAFVGSYGTAHRSVGPSGEEALALVVAPELAQSSRFEDELEAAAEALAGFSHPRVVETIVTGRDPSQRLVVVTGAPSEPVALASALGAGGRPPPAVAMALSRELAEGVAAAQAQGIVHGALHPQSVFLTDEGHAVIGDFAAGRALVEFAAAEDIDLAEGVGPYLAPEIAVAGAPGTTSDIYGLGALLFELWSGRPPPGEVVAPPEIAAVIEGALADHPASRFSSAADVERALAAAATEAGLLAAPPWQVSAWVREHVEARKRGAEAHLRAARARGRETGIPEVVRRPRQADLSRAAALARARGGRGDGPPRTPTPLADPGDPLGAASPEDALGRLDSALAAYEAPEPRASTEAELREDAGGRRVRAGELAGLAIALLAVVAIAWALAAMSSTGDGTGDGTGERPGDTPGERRSQVAS